MVNPRIQTRGAYVVNQHSVIGQPKETTTHAEETSSGKGKGVSWRD